MPNIEEEILKSFDEKFGKNFGWSDQDADGRNQVEKFISQSLEKVKLAERAKIRALVSREHGEKWSHATREVRDVDQFCIDILNLIDKV